MWSRLDLKRPSTRPSKRPAAEGNRYLERFGQDYHLGVGRAFHRYSDLPVNLASENRDVGDAVRSDPGVGQEVCQNDRKALTNQNFVFASPQAKWRLDVDWCAAVLAPESGDGMKHVTDIESAGSNWNTRVPGQSCGEFWKCHLFGCSHDYKGRKLMRTCGLGFVKILCSPRWPTWLNAVC